MIFSLTAAYSDKVIIEKLMGQSYSPVFNTKILTVPLRQVARFAYYHNDLVSAKEKDVLNRSFSYGYEGMRKNHNVNPSDPLIFNFKPSEINKEEFFNVYWSFFRKDPLLFLEGIIANSYGYYSIIPDVPAANLPGLRLPFLRMYKQPDRFLGHLKGIEYRSETKQLRVTIHSRLVQELRTLVFDEDFRAA